MKGWLTICGYIAGVAAIVFTAWLGSSELCRWYATGELLARFGGRGSPTFRRLITYESDPSNFVALFGINVLLAALGLAGSVLVCVRVQQWWRNKPEPNE
jgi:hypothetical protein